MSAIKYETTNKIKNIGVNLKSLISKYGPDSEHTK